MTGKATKHARKVAPLCPTCGKHARCSPGKFGVKAECCGLWSWNHKPLVGRETHRARILAHDAFDALWKRGAVPRSEAYRRLGVVMGLSAADCHIALMTAEQALRVVEIVASGALKDGKEDKQG